MIGHLEDGRSIYSGYLSQFGYDNVLMDHFFEVRDGCSAELLRMQQLVEQMKPIPPYITYAGAVQIPLTTEYFYHSATSNTLAEALKGRNSQHRNDDMFSVDSNSQIVFAGASAHIPEVEAFTRVIQTTSVHTLPDTHKGRQLYTLADFLIKKMKEMPVSYEFVMLLLGEGFHDDMGNVMQAIRSKLDSDMSI